MNFVLGYAFGVYIAGVVVSWIFIYGDVASPWDSYYHKVTNIFASGFLSILWFIAWPIKWWYIDQ